MGWSSINIYNAPGILRDIFSIFIITISIQMFHEFGFRKANTKKWKWYPRKFFTSLCLAIKKCEEKKLSFDTFPPLLQHMFLIKSSHCKFCAWLTYIKFSQLHCGNTLLLWLCVINCTLLHWKILPNFILLNLKFLVPGATIINRLEVKA